LLETDGRVDSATESGLLEADLEAIGDLRETIQAEAGTDSDDTPALHRVLRALDRVSEVWKFMYGLLVCDPVEPAEIFLAFQKICSRDASCPTKLCELVLLVRQERGRGLGWPRRRQTPAAFFFLSGIAGLSSEHHRRSDVRTSARPRAPKSRT
jgi:hypothetical protein